MVAADILSTSSNSVLKATSVKILYSFASVYSRSAYHNLWNNVKICTLHDANVSFTKIFMKICTKAKWKNTSITVNWFHDKHKLLLMCDTFLCRIPGNTNNSKHSILIYKRTDSHFQIFTDLYFPNSRFSFHQVQINNCKVEIFILFCFVNYSESAKGADGKGD